MEEEFHQSLLAEDSKSTQEGTVMQKFTRTIKREIEFPSSDPAIKPSTWIVEIGPEGKKPSWKGHVRNYRFMTF